MRISDWSSDVCSSDLKIHWDSKNNVPFPLIAKALKIGNQPVDSFTEVEWFPASIMTLRTGSAPAGVPMSEAGTFLNLHIMTPEVPGRTHYFYAQSEERRVGNEGVRTCRHRRSL